LNKAKDKKVFIYLGMSIALIGLLLPMVMFEDLYFWKTILVPVVILLNAFIFILRIGQKKYNPRSKRIIFNVFTSLILIAFVRSYIAIFFGGVILTGWCLVLWAVWTKECFGHREEFKCYLSRSL
jgi:hypothetical protein